MPFIKTDALDALDGAGKHGGPPRLSSALMNRRMGIIFQSWVHWRLIWPWLPVSLSTVIAGMSNEFDQSSRNTSVLSPVTVIIVTPRFASQGVHSARRLYVASCSNVVSAWIA